MQTHPTTTFKVGDQVTVRNGQDEGFIGIANDITDGMVTIEAPNGDSRVASVDNVQRKNKNPEPDFDLKNCPDSEL